MGPGRERGRNSFGIGPAENRQDGAGRVGDKTQGRFIVRRFYHDDADRSARIGV